MKKDGLESSGIIEELFQLVSYSPGEDLSFAFRKRFKIDRQGFFVVTHKDTGESLAIKEVSEIGDQFVVVTPSEIEKFFKSFVVHEGYRQMKKKLYGCMVAQNMEVRFGVVDRPFHDLTP